MDGGGESAESGSDADAELRSVSDANLTTLPAETEGVTENWRVMTKRSEVSKHFFVEHVNDRPTQPSNSSEVKLGGNTDHDFPPPFVWAENNNTSGKTTNIKLI